MCTPTCLDFVRRALPAEDIKGKSVLEAGSYNWNGSARDMIKALGPTSYIGADMTPGPGVDVVCDSGDLIKRFGHGSVEVLLTTEMFEHCRDWRAVLSSLKALVKPGGILVLTTRSQGFPYHACPFDFWRFSLDDMRALFSDFEILMLESDQEQPGVFIKARKPLSFTEKNLDEYLLYCIIKHRPYKRITSLDYFFLMAGHHIKQFWTVYLPKALKPFFPEKLRLRLKEWIMYPILHLFRADRKIY